MDEKVPEQVPPPLPVTSMGIKKNKSRFLLLSVTEVLAWALITASGVAITVGIVVAIDMANIPCSPTSWIFQCDDHLTLTAAQEDGLLFFGIGMLWLTVPQGVAAMAGLLLPRRRPRGRWSLAFVALVAATVAHYMYARAILVLLATESGPGDDFFRVVDLLCSVVLVVGDLISFISLFTGGAE